MTTESARRKERILLRASNLWFFGEGMFAPLFAVYAERIGGDVLDVAAAWAAYLIAMGFATMLVGRISDGKVGKERLMLAGYVLNAVFTFAYLLVRTPLDLLLVQVGIGLANALATPTWNALYAQYEDRKRPGSAWGLADGWSSVVTGVGVILGGLIVVERSFETLFVVMGIVQAAAAVYQFRILRDS